ISATSAPTGATINAMSGTSAGGAIVIDAGTQYTVSNPNCISCTGSYTIGGASSTGGSVNLSNVAMLTNDNSINITANPGSTKGSGAISAGDIAVYNGGFAGGSTPVVTVASQGSVSVGNIVNAIGGIFVSGGDLTVRSNSMLQSFGGDLSLFGLHSLTVGD